MAPSAEALVGIVSLVVALPPSALILWHCCRRPRRFMVDLEDPILVGGFLSVFLPHQFQVEC